MLSQFYHQLQNIVKRLRTLNPWCMSCHILTWWEEIGAPGHLRLGQSRHMFRPTGHWKGSTLWLTKPFSPRHNRQHFPFGPFHHHCCQLRYAQDAKRWLTRESKKPNMQGNYPSSQPSMCLSELFHKIWLSKCRKEANWMENSFHI